MGTMTRKDAIEIAQLQLKQLYNDLNTFGNGEHFSIIDPGCTEPSLIAVGFILEPAMLFLDKQMEEIEQEENDALPDEGNPGYAVGR